MLFSVSLVLIPYLILVKSDVDVRHKTGQHEIKIAG